MNTQKWKPGDIFPRKIRPQQLHITKKWSVNKQGWWTTIWTFWRRPMYNGKYTTGKPRQVCKNMRRPPTQPKILDNELNIEEVGGAGARYKLTKLKTPITR